MSRFSIQSMAAAALASIDASGLPIQDPDSQSRHRAEADRNFRQREIMIDAAEAKRARRAARNIKHRPVS